MGRKKLQIKKLEDSKQRNIAFAKRKNGLLKKAYELYALCDVSVALILFSPSRKLFILAAKTRLEETINKYVVQPSYKRPRLQDETNILRLVNQMRSESMVNGPNLRESLAGEISYQIQPKEIENEIEKYKAKLAEVERKLGKFLKNPNQCESRDELKKLEELHQMTLYKVQSRKKRLESKGKSVDVFGSPLENSMEDDNSSVE